MSYLPKKVEKMNKLIVVHSMSTPCPLRPANLPASQSPCSARLSAKTPRPLSARSTLQSYGWNAPILRFWRQRKSKRKKNKERNKVQRMKGQLPDPTAMCQA